MKEEQRPPNRYERRMSAAAKRLKKFTHLKKLRTQVARPATTKWTFNK